LIFDQRLARAPRREALDVPVVVDALGVAVDPAVAQRLVDGLLETTVGIPLPSWRT
jgi:hypothetical protein